jgi:hypothetical protein
VQRFDGVPCTPSFCGVFGSWPCAPSYPSIGRDSRITFNSRVAQAVHAPEGPINSIREMFAALQACWEPPPFNESFHGMEMSVRFSFKRTGELIGPPRVTYTNSNADADTRRIYGRAIDATFERCTPMPFSKEMGGAIAGQMIAIRFFDNRGEKKD